MSKEVAEIEEYERDVKSLGWLTESTLALKPAVPIEGISSNTLAPLKAILFETQSGISGQATKRGRRHPRLSSDEKRLKASNAGVERREAAEIERLREEAEASRKSLSIKATLYEQLASGQIGIENESSASSLVDFERKIWNQREEDPYQRQREMISPQERAMMAAKKEEQEENDDMNMIATSMTTKSDEKVLYIKKLFEQTKSAREKVKILRAERKKAAEERIRLVKMRKAVMKSKGGKVEEDMVEQRADEEEEEEVEVEADEAMEQTNRFLEEMSRSMMGMKKT